MLTSLIIPTKNEEEYIPILLESIKNQGLAPNELEVIVSDNYSTDKKRQIARNYGSIVVDGGHQRVGRNNGARIARGEILIFKDADGPLPDNFLIPALREFNERKLDVAGTLHYPISTKKGFTTLRHKLYIEFFSNRSIQAAENTNSPLMMNCMFVRNLVHRAIGGFDETIEFGEDSEYAKRVKRAGGSFGILKTAGRVGHSMRRFEEREINALLKNIYFNAGRSLGHEFRKDKSLISYQDKK